MRRPVEIRKAHFPGRAPIDTYGNGGFRFAEMSHRGSLLLLPSGIYGWDLVEGDPLTPEAFERVFQEAAEIEVMLVPPWVVRVSGSRAMRPTRITRLVMGFLLIEHSGSIPAANPSRSAPRRSAPKGNPELVRVVRAAGHAASRRKVGTGFRHQRCAKSCPATRSDLIRVARLDGG